MLRLFGNILRILSLLLALTTIVIWFRSRTNTDDFDLFYEYYAPGNHFIVKGLRILVSRGELWIHIDNCDIDLALDIPQAEAIRDHAVLGWNARLQTTPGAAAIKYLLGSANLTAGFSFQNGTTNRHFWVIRLVEIAVPLWLASLLLCLPSLMYIFGRLKRHRRLRHGLCPICGYDLRESKGTCPECGANQRPAVSTVTASPLAKHLRE
jgi:hypothetical protein